MTGRIPVPNTDNRVGRNDRLGRGKGGRGREIAR